MFRHILTRPALAVGLLLLLVSPLPAQYYPAGGWYRSGPPAGYWVRGLGYYDGSRLPPGPGVYDAYYQGRPFVTVADPWGRVADVQLRPKVLYYSDQFLTPHGGFYPRSIVVVPDDRRRSFYQPVPASSDIPAATRNEVPLAPRRTTTIAPATRGAEPSSAALGPAPLEEPPAKPIPPAAANEPVPVKPIPPAADTDSPLPAGPPQLPRVPELPRLPDVPSIPGAAPAALAKPATIAPPKLGPAPMDVPPPK